MKMSSLYRAQWFDPREGTWIDASDHKLATSVIGTTVLPPLPDGQDWGLKLVYEGPADVDPSRPVIELPRETRKVKLFKKYWPYAAATAAGVVAASIGFLFLGWLRRRS